MATAEQIEEYFHNVKDSKLQAYFAWKDAHDPPSSASSLTAHVPFLGAVLWPCHDTTTRLTVTDLLTPNHTTFGSQMRWARGKLIRPTSHGIPIASYSKPKDLRCGYCYPTLQLR
eukprot:m.230373 g.230373  ORF g.230373 m.230373 type:complete len:115 (-) comp17353_c0_seq23:2038-2382(-)